MFSSGLPQVVEVFSAVDRRSDMDGPRNRSGEKARRCEISKFGNGSSSDEYTASPDQSPISGDSRETTDATERVELNNGSVRMDGSSLSREDERLERVQHGSPDAIEESEVQDFLTALRDKTKSIQYLFMLYRRIPGTGVQKLSNRSRAIFLRRLGAPAQRRRVDARRYVAVLDDMAAADIPMTRSHWTTAIHLVGRGTAGGRVSPRELEQAIGVWRRMEHMAGLKADRVVFNVLFDIALRAEQYTVVERLLAEMRSRGLDLDRFGRVSYIVYKGELGDVDGLHQAFDDFVASGEIVDTVVMNCLITAFMRAGDFHAAERIYLHMMDARKAIGQRSKVDSLFQPSLTAEFSIYRTQTKTLGRHLQRTSGVSYNISPSLHDRARRQSYPLTPDMRTFHVMLSYYTRIAGDLNGVMSILKDMKATVRATPNGLVYFLIFDGFARFGGWKEQWSAENLREAWKACFELILDSQKRYREQFYRRSNKPKSSFEDADLLHTHFSMFPTKSVAGSIPNWLFDAETYDLELMEREQAEVERRIKNGLFFSPRMIVSILRAFGACCSRDELLDVWLRIEAVWRPAKRKMEDVFYIKDELDRQIARASGQPWR